MSNSLVTVHLELVAEWSEKNLPLIPDSITFGSHKKVIWKCKLGHEWIAAVKSRTINRTGPIMCCPNIISRQVSVE